MCADTLVLRPSGRSKPDGAELDPEQQRVVGDGARMSRPLPELLPILLARVAEVGRRDGAEGDDLDRLDLDLPVTDAVATPNLDLGAAPETERDRDISRQHPFSQLGAELHVPRLRAQSRRGTCAIRSVRRATAAARKDTST
jgi:hypothetical protein